MLVRDVSTFLVAPGWIFVRVRTDEGLIGWGECGVQTHPEAVAAAVGRLGGLLIGADPAPIERHWQLMTKHAFYRGGGVLSAAVAGLDIALWDLAGKRLGVPVHALLGGPVRDRAPAYAWIGEDPNGDDTPDVLAADAARKVAAGHRAVKMTPWLVGPVDTPTRAAAIASQANAVREAIGDENELMVDLHGRCTLAMARRLLPLLEPSRPLFVEEPVLPEYPEALALLAAATSIPLATGERLFSRWDVKSVLASGVSVLQPDVAQAGGVSETRRIAALAEAYDISVAPHCAIGPIALAASIQIGFATPNLLRLEEGVDYFETDAQRYVPDMSFFAIADGCFARPAGPGLGIEIDEAAVEASPAHVWTPHRIQGPDGGFAEW